MPADFVISQIFAVARERMFTLWTDVELLKQWFGPAATFTFACKAPTNRATRPTTP